MAFKTHCISVKLSICYAAYDNVQVILSLCKELRYRGSGGTAPLILNVDTGKSKGKAATQRVPES